MLRQDLGKPDIDLEYCVFAVISSKKPEIS